MISETLGQLRGYFSENFLDIAASPVQEGEEVVSLLRLEIRAVKPVEGVFRQVIGKPNYRKTLSTF